MLSNVLITGITNLECYPRFRVNKYCKEGMVNDTLCIPEEKPDIESVNEIKIGVEAEEYKIIRTILGPKILVYGCMDIKVIYTADNCQQSLHSAHWSIPFCDFVLLKDLSYERCQYIIKGIFIGIEDVCVTYFNKRVVDLSSLYILCPHFSSNNINDCCAKSSEYNCNQESYSKKNNYCKEDYGYKLNVYNNN